MFMRTHTRRPIGRILLDGGFVSPRDLAQALEEQKRTNELLGQVLVRMGVIDPADLTAALAVQEHLSRGEEAARTAAGMRQMLGGLLVRAGHITVDQLDQALTEQKRSGDRLGEVLVRRGLLTRRQLDGVLDFQERQSAVKPAPGPLRLGELLVSTGVISREQLADALRKQAESGKKLGEVLVDAGYAEPRHIARGIRLQQMLVTAALVALLAACGGGAGTAPQQGSAAATAQQEEASANYLVTTTDEYGLLAPNFYYSTDNPEFWSIQSAVADDVHDQEFRTIIRVDIPKSESGGMPDISGRTFSIEDSSSYEKFPGVIVVMNGRQSVRKRVEQGTVSFTAIPAGARDVQGAFDVVLTDYDAPLAVPPQYRLAGAFSFRMGTSGAIAAR